jgi:hypothetical protein
MTEGEALEPLSVQYHEWTGTVELDNADNSSIEEIANERLGDRAADYFVVGFDFFIGKGRVIAGHPLSTGLTLYLLSEDDRDTVADAIKNPNGVLNVFSLSVDPTPKVEEFFRQVSKRFEMRLTRGAIDRSGTELRLAGDLNELENLEPSDFDEES